MDGSTNGESSLRFVKRLNNNQISSSKALGKNPREEKRRQLLLERRSQKLIQLWRTIFFILATYGLGFLVVNNGWREIDIEQIHIKGSEKLKPSSIANISGINFPKPLLLIDPKEFERNILNELPIKSISIRRRLIPPRIEIEIQERNAIAFADKIIQTGKEKGMIDEDGGWIPISMRKYINEPSQDFYVEGWMASHQNWISIIIRNKEKLGSTLKGIVINQNGEINLKTSDFELIQLGNNSSSLKRQIKALQKLSQNLPKRFVSKKGTILDIRDPSKPEFQIKNFHIKKKP